MGRLKGTVGWVLAAALLCLMTSPASAAIALVQQKTNSNNNATSLNVTLTSNTTVGNLLVLVGETGCFPLKTPTGGGVTTWQFAKYSDIMRNIEIWYGVVSTAATVVTIGPNNSPPPCSGTIRGHVMEFSGLYADQATVFDKANSAYGTTSPAPATSWAGITTTNANDLLVFGIADDATNTFGNPPTGGGWTNLTTITTTIDKTSDWYRVVSSATTYKPTVTDTGTVHWDVALASFKACPTVADVSYVTANAQNGQATVYWPSATSVVVLRKQGAAFTNEKPGDNLTYTTNTDPLGTVGAAHVSYVGSGPMPADTSLLNTGTSYYYKVFVNNGSQCYSPGVSVNVAPNASVPKWTYDTTATSMAPPGLAPNDVVIAGSGDWNIHALEASNTLNGIRAFAPVLTLNVIQSRPAVIPSDLGPGLYSAYDAQTGLAYWKFDEGSGTTAADSSGNNNAGTLQGSPLPAWTAGVRGNALSFDGSQNYVSVPHAAALNNWPITVTAWFKTSSTTGSPGIVNKYVSASSNGWQLFMYNGGLCAWYFSNVTHFINNDGSGNCNPGPGGVTGYNNNTWHHAAFVVDASGGWLYVDGALKSAVGWSGGSPTGFQPSTTQPINIGRYGTAYFPGLIDDVRIYNRALTAAEVSAVYSGLNVAYVTSTDNSVYAINTNTGSQVFPKWVSGTTLWGGPAVWLTAVKPSVAICGVKTDVVFVGTRIVGAATNKVYALNGSNAAVTTSVTGGLCPVVNTVVQAGNPIWTYTGTNMYYITSTPYVDYANSAVWVTSRANASTANPSVWMFNVSNGNPINSWTGIGDIDADPTPTADGSVMYVGNTSGALWALKTTSPYTNYASYTPATGAGGLKSIPWPVGSGMPDTIIFSRNATVHMVTFTGSAFDSSSTPGKYWNLAPSGAPTVVSAPVDDGAGNVYVGDNNGKLHRIVISSGTEAVTSPVSAPVAAILGDPSYDVTNNLIYIGASDGHIYAFTAGF